MRTLLRHVARGAAAPLLFVVLAGLFVGLQVFGTPPALGSLRSLAPAETGSPRATLEGFRAHAGTASRLLMEAYRQNKTEPGFLWSTEVADKVREAEILLARSARAFDLSQIPPVELEHRRLESTLLLKEILDRVPLPALDEMPGAEAKLQSWNIPGTEIRITRQGDGPRAGEYLFSAETVRLLPEFYDLVRHEPDIGGSTGDFYDFFSQSPGYLLPPKWFSLIEALPAWFRMEISGQAVWQWIGIVLVVGIAGMAVWSVHRMTTRRARGERRTGVLVDSILLPASVVVAALSVAYLSDYQINLTGAVNDVVDESAKGIAYLAGVWGILRFSAALAGNLSFSRRESIDAHLARAAVRICGIAVAVVLLIYGASYLGLPLAGVLAGLGVGGLAVALAAKPTLENFIGGLILYADRPVRVGDLCRFGTLEGRVQEIGIRSTRIRGLDRSLITIPNATFVNLNIINLTNRDRMPYKRSVTLRETDSIGIRQEVAALTDLVSKHPMIEKGSLEVRLREELEEKPKAEIRALITTSRWEEFLRIQQDLDLMLRDATLKPEAGGAGSEDAPDDNRPIPLESVKV